MVTITDAQLVARIRDLGGRLAEAELVRDAAMARVAELEAQLLEVANAGPAPENAIDGAGDAPAEGASDDG